MLILKLFLSLWELVSYVQNFFQVSRTRIIIPWFFSSLSGHHAHPQIIYFKTLKTGFMTSEFFPCLLPKNTHSLSFVKSLRPPSSPSFYFQDFETWFHVSKIFFEYLRHGVSDPSFHPGFSVPFGVPFTSFSKLWKPLLWFLWISFKPSDRGLYHHYFSQVS